MEETGGLSITPEQLHTDDDVVGTTPDVPSSSHVVIDTHSNTISVGQVLAGETNGTGWGRAMSMLYATPNAFLLNVMFKPKGMRRRIGGGG